MLDGNVKRTFALVYGLSASASPAAVLLIRQRLEYPNDCELFTVHAPFISIMREARTDASEIAEGIVLPSG